MATTSHQFQPQSLPSAMENFVFPVRAAQTPTKRPSSSSAIPTKPMVPAAIPSPTYSDNGPSPLNSPSTYVFPVKQSATFPRSANSLGNNLFPGNSPLRTPPLSPTPPTSTLGERRVHARRPSDLAMGRPLSMGALSSSSSTPGSGLSTLSPSRSGASSPNKDASSPRFSSQNGLLSPPPEPVVPVSPPTVEKGIPAPAPPGKQGRRGHAHRRSSALSMSSGEVLNLMLTAAKAQNPGNPATNKAGSVPTSPTLSPGSPPKEPVVVIENVSAPEIDTKPTLEVPPCAVTCDSSASSIANLTTDESETSTRTSLEEAPRRARVTFSDATEIIPRPASAGTCSTLTTIRGGMGDSVSSLHAYRNSIGSMEELHHVDSRTRRASASDASGQSWGTKAKADRRPSSADAATLLNGANKSNWFFPPLSPKDPSSKKKGHSKHLSESSATDKSKRKNRKASNPDGVPATPKKVKGGMKGWANTMLWRRHNKKRQLKNLPRRSPTPPLMQRDEIQRLMMEGSYVLMPPRVSNDYQPRESSSMEEMEFEGQIDLGMYETEMETLDFPVIDLDAALGPFTLPKSPNKQVSGFDAARKRMHSAAGWNCYHRRAESMPEMQLFSLAEDEIEGDGMGDVFEDTEEEDEDDADLTLQQDDFPLKPPAGLALDWGTDDSEIEELDIVDGLSNVRKGIKRKMSRLSEDTDMTGSEGPRSEDGMKLDDVPAPSIDTIAVPTPSTDKQQPSPALSTPGYLNKPMSNLSTNVSYGSLHHASSFEQTPAVTPSTTNTSICATTPSTPVNNEFLGVPSLFPHIYIEDDRATIMSGASIYEDPIGEPGPEIRLSISGDDIPSTSYSSSRFYPAFLASTSWSTMPGLETSSTMTSEKTKEKKDKKWSKMFAFWKGRSSTS